MKSKSRKSWCSFVPRKGATCFRTFPKVKSACSSPGNAQVFLNVYDLTPINGYFYWAGVGVFHSGVEVYGVEYAFGAHDYRTSGVFEVEPRQCPGFRFRKSILIGMTHLDPKEVREFMECQSVNYSGDSYHLVAKNCNHFTEDISYKLTGKQIPKWVNRLARIGSLCNCILPEALKVSAIKPGTSLQVCDSEKKRLRSSFSCLSSISLHQRDKEVSISSLLLHSHHKGCSPPWDMKKTRTNSLEGK